MNETERHLLRRLRDSVETGLPRSQLPRSCAGLVQALTTCGAAELRPAVSGRGFVLRVTDSDAFQCFIDARLPGGLNVDTQAITDRATAVALLANAKVASNGVGQAVLLRSWKPGIFLTSSTSEGLCVSEVTHQAGAACINLAADESWHFAGSVAVVENEDAFWQAELVIPSVDLAILSRGRMSKRLLQWLGSGGMGECRILHWGDYDPVGIAEFVRLFESYGERADVFAPPEVDKLLPRFGKRELVTTQARFLDQLRRRVSIPYVSRMLNLFDRYRRGLEQELLLRTELH